MLNPSNFPQHQAIVEGVNAAESKAKSGWFSCPGSPGLHSVTGIGYKPKRVAFLLQNNQV